MKRRSFLEKLLKKTGQFTDEQLTEFIEKMDEEYPDADAETALAILMTEDEAVGSDKVFGKIKGKAKAEALDPIDALLKTYVPKLTPTQKAEFDQLSADSHEKYQFILKAFDESGTKTGDKNYDDLKADYDSLKMSLANEYVPKSEYETVTGKLSVRDREILNVRLLNAAIRSGKLRDVSNDRHFERNFVADTEELLSTGLGDKKIKGVIDHLTGKVMRADSPDQPLLLNNKAIMISDLAELTISAYDYERKSDTPPTNSVKVPASSSNATGAAKSSALQAMIAEEQNRK